MYLRIISSNKGNKSLIYAIDKWLFNYNKKSY